MRILILQLARFGDIYITWPTLRALRRTYPHAEIHLMVKQRFLAATKGLEGVVDFIHSFDSAAILKPIFDEDTDLSQAICSAVLTIEQAIEPLQNMKFDKIFNFTFSPLSSFMTHALSHEETTVCGYTRHDDGLFDPIDDLASYFYAQVGIELDNQIHLVRLFAAGAGVELQQIDRLAPVLPINKTIQDKLTQIPSDHLVVAVQPYASLKEKSLNEQQWQKIIDGLLESERLTLIFVGGTADIIPTRSLCKNKQRTIDCVGQTVLSELFGILRRCDMLLAPDSVTIHMAGLTDTPVLNLAFSNTNSYETGPWSSRSQIVRADEPELLNPIEVVVAVKNQLFKNLVPTQDPIENYAARLVRAIYFSDPFPLIDSGLNQTGYKRLVETMILAIEQCDRLLVDPKARTAMLILKEIDDVVNTIVAHTPDLAPLQRWYHCELARIRPSVQQDLVLKTKSIYEKMLDWAQLGLLSRTNHTFDRKALHDHSQMDLE